MKTRLHNLTLVFVLTATALLAPGCQSNRSAVGGFFDLDTDLKISFVIGSDVNPDGQGTPSPLFVRMYQMKTSKAIDKADFIDLFERDKTLLGGDLIGPVRILESFSPGERREEVFVIDPDAQYVGFFAEFRNYDDSAYKLVVPVVINNVFRDTAVVEISGNSMGLAE